MDVETLSHWTDSFKRDWFKHNYGDGRDWRSVVYIETYEPYFKHIEWIKENIPDWRNNAEWILHAGRFYIRMRHREDLIIFKLRWGS